MAEWPGAQTYTKVRRAATQEAKDGHCGVSLDPQSQNESMASKCFTELKNREIVILLVVNIR